MKKPMQKAFSNFRNSSLQLPELLESLNRDADTWICDNEVEEFGVRFAEIETPGYNPGDKTWDYFGISVSVKVSYIEKRGTKIGTKTFEKEIPLPAFTHSLCFAMWALMEEYSKWTSLPENKRKALVNSFFRLTSILQNKGLRLTLVAYYRVN